MSDWRIILPDPTINRSLNPSAEAAGNYGNVAGGAVTRVTTASFLGVRAYRLVTGADNDGGTFTLDTLANAIHYVTMRIRGTLPPGWDWSLDNAAFTSPVLLEDYDGDWSLYGLQFPAVQANGSTTLRVYQDGAGAGDFNIDSIQVEEKAYWTTACDGDQPGCEWLGAAHASISQRSALSRAGGWVRDLQDDYRFEIGQFISTGMPPLDLSVDSYAILPGGELNSIKVMSRVFTLTGVIRGTDTANLHANKQALLNVLKPGAVPGDQPVRIRYIGAAVVKQIAAYYESGLETSIIAEMPCWERLAIRFLADDPFWYEIGDSAEELDTEDTDTFNGIAARLRSIGQWDPLGPPIPGGVVRALAISDEYVYVGGQFVNWNGLGGAGNYIVQWDGTVWSGVGGADNWVRALVLAADGSLYAGGGFTNIGGGAAESRVAIWDGAVWAALGLGVDNWVYALALGLDGTLYAGGTFANAGGAAAARIASWDGAAWAVLGVGMSATVYALAVGLDGTLYAGGAFVNAGGVAVNYVAAWDGTAWSALGTGMNNFVYALAVGVDGTLYAGGSFTTAGGTAASRIAKWNGTAWEPLGTGANSEVQCLAIGPDGILYAGGNFTEMGGITLADRAAKWNGSSWAHLDVNLPGNPFVYSIATDDSDPVVEQNYDVWLGFSTSGIGTYAGASTVINDGTESAYPKFVISRAGGTSSIIEEIRNETTGKELLFNYALLDGEILTIDLEPTAKSIVSSFFGPRPDAILPNSDFGSFALQPGINLITGFVAQVLVPSTFNYLIWKDTYWSND